MLVTALSCGFSQIGLDFTSSHKIRKPSKTARQYAMTAAKEALLPMLEAVTLLEDCISKLKGGDNEDIDGTSGCRQRVGSTDTATTQNFVKVSPADADLSLPQNVSTAGSSLSKLVSCQDLLLQTSSGLLTDCVQAGPSASTLTWALVVKSLQDATFGEECDVGTVVQDQGIEQYDARSTGMPSPLLSRTARSLLCRLATIVIMKINRMTSKSARGDSASPWSSSDLCGGIARTIDLIEEKSLLKPPQQEGDRLSSEQVALICAIIQLAGSDRRGERLGREGQDPRKPQWTRGCREHRIRAEYEGR